MMIVIIDNKEYNVKIVEKKIKHGHMKVDVNNNIKITGYKISEIEAKRLIEKNIDWLRKIIKKNNETNKKLNLTEVKNKEKVWLFGKVFNLVNTKDSDLHFRIDGEILYYKGKFNEKKFQDHFCEVLRRRFEYYNDVFSKNANLEFKLMRSKYGYCRYNENLIVLSRNIIHLPGDLIDYIMIHEFCHFKHPNHSKDFYEEVKKYCPDYKIRVRKLKEYSALTK